MALFLGGFYMYMLSFIRDSQCMTAVFARYPQHVGLRTFMYTGPSYIYISVCVDVYVCVYMYINRCSVNLYNLDICELCSSFTIFKTIYQSVTMN
jgi:hypothetical protein